MPKAPRVTSALGHLDVIRCVDYSPDGRAFATGGCDHAVCLWDGVTGRCFRVMEGHSGVVRALRFSPNGARLASASQDHTLRLWAPRAGARGGLFSA